MYREQYESLLREMHGLMVAGKGDSQEADILMGKGDEIWELLTTEERVQMRDFSESLLDSE